MKTIIKLINYGLALAVVLAAGALIYISTPIFGNKALIVRSGSMQPTIDVGDLVVISRNTSGIYKIGEIIAFRGIKSDVLTTHRITNVVSENGTVLYETQGDANKNTDQVLVPTEKVIGSYSFNIPKIGKLLAFTKTNYGFAALIILPALLVIVMEIFNIFKEVRKQEREDAEPYSKHTRILGFRAILPFALSILLIQSSFAYFTDTETSTNNIFEAADSFGPPIADHVVISEAQIRGSAPSPTQKDFIELYNPTSTPFNLNGHRLVKRSGSSSSDGTIKSWTSDTFIPAHGYYLWARNSTSTFPSSIGADTSTSVDIGDNNSIALRLGLENIGTIIDALSWNSSSNSLKEGTEFGNNNPSANESIERKALSTSTAVTMGIGGSDEFKGNGFDSNNNATDFILRSLSQPQNSSSPTEAP